MDVVKQSEPKPYKNYRWIIADPEWLGGKPAIRGTRLSVAQILECLSAEMTVDDINESFGGGVTPEAIQEALRVAADLVDHPCVAA
jgi:uncharacterized protein (DUF433 family)